MSQGGRIVIFRLNLGIQFLRAKGLFMSDFWDFRGWERNEENNDWQDIQGDNLEYRADGLTNRAIASGLDKENLDKTITYIAAAADINRQIGRIPELVDCLQMLADCYLRQERGEDVFEVAIEVEKIALESFNDRARAKSLHLQGYTFFLKKQYSIAGDFSANAAALYESAGWLDDAFATYVAAGRLYRWRGERSKSIAAFQNALRVSIANEDIECMVEAKSWIAVMQLRVSPIVDLDEAAEFIAKAKEQSSIAKVKNITLRRLDAADSWLKVHTAPIDAARNFDFLAEFCRSEKQTIDSTEMTLGRAYALCEFENGEKYVQALRSILAVIEELDSTVAVLEVVEPLADFYSQSGQHIDAEQVWVRGRAIAEKRGESDESLQYFDQMIALCISQYADPGRALGALESKLPKTNETPLPYAFEYALAKSYAANDRATESLIVIDRALENMPQTETPLMAFAELHELKCELMAKQGNQSAVKAEARISFDAYFDLGEIEKAKRLKEKYLKPEPGDADPDTGAITLGNWG
jgi:tetratricopeptide (TPR) repeat protein